MKIYANDSSNLIRVLFTEDEERQYPDTPPGMAYSLEMDADTNPQIVAALQGSVLWQDIRLIDDVLSYQGTPVMVNPPGETYLDREYLRDWWQALNTAMDNVGAAIAQTEQAQTAWPGMTAQQKQQWLVDHFDEVLGGLALALRVIHGVLRFIRWLIKGHFKMEEL